MPATILKSVRLNDLTADVSVTGPAHGDLFVRGASSWNNLAAGQVGQWLLPQSGGGVAYSDTTTRSKTFSCLDSTIPIVSIKEAASTSLSALDLYNKQTSQGDQLARFWSDGAGVGLPGTYQPRAYFSGNAQLLMQTGIIVSGTFTGSGDTFTVVPPDPSGVVNAMVSIWADISKCPAFQIRQAAITNIGWPIETIDHAGAYRWAVAEDGGIWWGETTTRNPTTGFPELTVNLYTPDSAVLKTDNSFAVGGSQVKFGTSTGQQITFEVGSAYAASTIHGSGSGGSYPNVLFLNPTGAPVCIGANGYNLPAQLNVRQFGSNDLLVCEIGSTALLKVDSHGNTLLNTSAPLATTATSGFPVLPTCAGTPTGTPTGGSGAMIYDTSGKHLWIYNGVSWESH